MERIASFNSFCGDPTISFETAVNSSASFDFEGVCDTSFEVEGIVVSCNICDTIRLSTSALLTG